MKTKMYVVFLGIVMLFQFGNAQEAVGNAPKIENYTKGKLEIKIASFGLDNPIQVGEITPDGSILFKWDYDIAAIKDSEFYMSSIKNSLGMNFCNDKEIVQSNEEAKALRSKDLFLYKDGQQVGVLFAGTQKGIENNNGSNRRTGLILGSTISWVYTDSDVLYTGTCSVNFEQENLYNFKEVTRYDLNFKKGWNMVLNTLVEKEDWKNGAEIGSLPKSITKTSISNIPETMSWYLNYWAE